MDAASVNALIICCGVAKEGNTMLWAFCLVSTTTNMSLPLKTNRCYQNLDVATRTIGYLMSLSKIEGWVSLWGDLRAKYDLIRPSWPSWTNRVRHILVMAANITPLTLKNLSEIKISRNNQKIDNFKGRYLNAPTVLGQVKPYFWTFHEQADRFW